MQGILKQALYAAVTAFVWGAYHLNPETAQLKDFLLLLHSTDVQLLFAILLVGQVFLDASNAVSVTYSNKQYLKGMPAASPAAPAKKSDIWEDF